jgi:hypothetical protein
VWFEAISPQIQGEELFKKTTVQVPVKANYDDLMQEIDRTEVLEPQDEERRDKQRRKPSRWSVFSSPQCC